MAQLTPTIEWFGGRRDVVKVDQPGPDCALVVSADVGHLSFYWTAEQLRSVYVAIGQLLGWAEREQS